MKDKYLDEYIDINGNVIIRNKINRLKTLFYAIFKRFFDLSVSFLLLILLLPILIIISIIIKIDSKGPIIFKQKRTGKNGKVFELYKFRTMSSDNDVKDFTKCDKHTRVGAFLRKTSLDELPQLMNILKSQMSFIGPRPWITDYYDNMNDTQRRRNCIRPGITGLAQCMGRNNITIFEKINYDLEYIKNYSLSQDIKIFYLTIISVFKASGVDAGKSTIKKEIEELKKYNK